MIETPQILQTEPIRRAFIHLTVPRSEIQRVMGPGLGEVMAAIMSQGIAPAGPWFTYHLHRPTDVFDFEISVPISAPFDSEGRVRSDELPSIRVARTIYRGPYEQLGEGWGEFQAWIKSNGHTPASELWECYVVGPESSPDPCEWQTQLNQPLTD